MARTARTVSVTGFYHVIVRGNGKQILFENKNDYLFYISNLERFGEESGIRIVAYCLMDNHVHLLLNDTDSGLALFMKQIGVSYSRYYNRKYDRSGHLFQNRYYSEPVNDTAYLLTVLRYILQNPEKAGICSARKYAWSSYHAYADENSFVDTRVFSDILGSREAFAEFISGETTVRLEGNKPEKDDTWAKRILLEELGLSSGSMLRDYSRKERNAALRKLKEKGLSVRQIERLTGIGRSIIFRA